MDVVILVFSYKLSEIQFNIEKYVCMIFIVYFVIQIYPNNVLHLMRGNVVDKISISSEAL